MPKERLTNTQRKNLDLNNVEQHCSSLSLTKKMVNKRNFKLIKCREAEYA